MQTPRTLWHDRLQSARRYPALAQDMEVDIAIVGAGITGLTLAWQLRNSGLRVAVFEAAEVGGGTTGAATGNLYTTVGPGLATIERKHGGNAVAQVIAARAAAIDFIESMVRDQGIECDFERVPFYRFAAKGSNMAEFIRNEVAAADRAGLRAGLGRSSQLPFEHEALFSLQGQAQLDPLRYVAALAGLVSDAGIPVFEQTRVLEMKDGNPCVLTTEGGEVRAQHLVKATHIPQGRYYLHAQLIPRREYALLVRLRGSAPANGIYWACTSEGLYSIRPWRDEQHEYLLVLGQSHAPGEQQQEHLIALESFVRAHFDVVGIDYLWCAQNYKPADHLPYIGKSYGENHTWIATGFAADGLVWGTVAAQVIADALTGVGNSYAHLLSPRRFTPLASMQLTLKESKEVSRHLFEDHLTPTPVATPDSVPPGEGRVMKIGGDRVAVYRDDKGTLQMVSAICPHMGCLVHWNGFEKSWDCPCHGSRFRTDGTLIEGPSPKGLTVVEPPRLLPG